MTASSPGSSAPAPRMALSARTKSSQRPSPVKDGNGSFLVNRATVIAGRHAPVIRSCNSTMAVAMVT